MGLVLPEHYDPRLSVRETGSNQIHQGYLPERIRKRNEPGKNICTIIRRKEQWSER